MSARFPTKGQLDALLPQLEAHARDWVERECNSFDADVLKQTSKSPEEGSILDMPAIDSKRVVSLLTELEKLIGGGRKLPVSAIKSGGYTSADDLIAKLFSRLREKCPDAPKAGHAPASIPPQAAVVSPPP